MATLYEPDKYLGDLLSTELKLATFREECPEGVWDALKREKEVRQALRVKKQHGVILPQPKPILRTVSLAPTKV